MGRTIVGPISPGFVVDKKLYLTPFGNCQLIPGMADFSQGVFQQSVGRVKKEKKKRANSHKSTLKLSLKCITKHYNYGSNRKK